jgi:Fe-S-cluster containining protein
VSAALRFDPEQRFGCARCGRCCRRTEIVVTAAEVESYGAQRAERWYRESETADEGASAGSPFEPVRGARGFFLIRKRPDGACGFLSPQGLCRLHEELGESRKPLTCRMFPFRLHPTALGPVLTASFACPTVVASEGPPLGEQARALDALAARWSAVHPEHERPVRITGRRAMPAAALGTLREVLEGLLDRPGPAGRPDLRANVGRIARTLEDLSRYRVQRLADERLAEYLELTGRFAVRTEKPVAPRAPSRLGRLLFRGVLFAVTAVRLQAENRAAWGLRLGLRLRLFRVLAHLNGLGPPAGGVDLGALRRVDVPLDLPEIHALVDRYLRASVRTLGTGRRTLVEEMGVAVALLNAALALAAMATDGRREAVGPADVQDALTVAADVTHVGERTLFGRIVTLLAAGVEPLYQFEAGGPGRSLAPAAP